MDDMSLSMIMHLSEVNRLYATNRLNDQKTSRNSADNLFRLNFLY